MGDIHGTYERRYRTGYGFHDHDRPGRNTAGRITERGQGRWGYAAIGEDFNTIQGATFDHKGETPGLGAEINKDEFEKPFQGKQIFDNDGEFTSVRVIKGGADPADLHGVDAISGGTITSNGVSEMLERTFKAYEPFLKSKMNS